MTICPWEYEKPQPRCVLEVSEKNLQHNYEIIRRAVTGKMIAVVKGDGYGLGLVEYSRRLEAWGVPCLAVSRPEEGMSLRQAGITTDILVMTPVEDRESAAAITELDLIASVGSREDILRLENAGGLCRVHIKLDTGFGRYGLLRRRWRRQPFCCSNAPTSSRRVYLPIAGHCSAIGCTGSINASAAGQTA